VLHINYGILSPIVRYSVMYSDNSSALYRSPLTSTVNLWWNKDVRISKGGGGLECERKSVTFEKRPLKCEKVEFIKMHFSNNI
jgi:hypothetical protein